MDKGDWEFIVSITVGLLGLAGLDWKLVAGRLQKPPMKKREWFVICALICSLFFSTAGWYRYMHQPHFSSKKIPDYEIVEDKTFRNVKVPLDGKLYKHCVFINVTFVYEGTGGFGVENNTIAGSRMVESANPAVQMAWLVQKALGIEPVAPVFDGSGHALPSVENPLPENGSSPH